MSEQRNSCSLELKWFFFHQKKQLFELSWFTGGEKHSHSVDMECIKKDGSDGIIIIVQQLSILELSSLQQYGWEEFCTKKSDGAVVIGRLEARH